VITWSFFFFSPPPQPFSATESDYVWAESLLVLHRSEVDAAPCLLKREFFPLELFFDSKN